MRFAAALMVVVALGLAFAWSFQRRMIYFPMAHVPSAAESRLAGYEAVRFTTSDGLELDAWFLKLEHPPPRSTVIVFNGNAGNRAHRVELGDALRARGFQVLLVDYRGYGGNPGSPTEHGLAADSRAARAYAVSRDDVDPSRLVYFGESLGAAVAAELAMEFPPSALILRSPFTSISEVGQYHYPILPVRLLVRDRFPTIDRIHRLHSPLLVIAGEEDRIVPFEQSQRVYALAPEPKAFLAIAGVDHNDLELLAGDEIIDAIARFVEEQAQPTAPARADRRADDARRNEMVEEQIARRGVSDPRVLDALRKVPRERFVPANQAARAYEDRALPIARGQTISQPYIVAYMTEALRVAPSHRVLEIGTGSGYQAAVLGEIAREVYSIEIVPELAAGAAATLADLGYAHVQVREGDGYAGWPERAPFDRIIVTAAVKTIPGPLIDQLAPGGVLVVPVGSQGQTQWITIVEKGDRGVVQRRTIPVQFVPFTRREPAVN